MKLYMVIKKEFVRNAEGKLKKVIDVINDEPVTRHFAKKIEALGSDRTIMTVEMFNREIQSGYMTIQG